jgi:hypothetical protein
VIKTISHRFTFPRRMAKKSQSGFF